jgi:hypothetical protein
VNTLLALVLFLQLLVDVSSIPAQMSPLPALAAQSSSLSSAAEVPTIDFCDLVKHPQRYYDKTVRITAKWKTGFEFSYLSDDRCLKASDNIAVKFVNDETQREVIKANVDKIMSHEYGGRARIRIVGTLHKPFKRYYGYFRYIFEILRFEHVAHLVVPYQGVMQAGTTYQATVRGDKDLGLSLVPPLRMFVHQSAFIEWTNLSEFPGLEKLRDSNREGQIVFSVLSDENNRMTQQRWNRTLRFKIIRTE